MVYGTSIDAEQMDSGQLLDGFNAPLIFKLAATIVALLLWFVLRWAVKRAISNYAITHKFSPSRIASAHRAVSVIGFLVLVAVLAVAWSINVQSVLVVLGAILATIGIGFLAGWSILSNVTASIIMFWRLPMHVGDRVGLTGNQSFVAVAEEFTPFYIIRENLGGTLIALPNR